MRNHLRVIPSAARDLLFLRWGINLCVIALSIIFSLRAQAQEPVPLAHGNVPGEPHHHLKIENEYVRAYYVEVPPHEATQLHQHDHDYIYVSLGPSDVMNAPLNKPEVHLALKDGEVHFTRGGFAHVARNLADTPFRNVTVELLKPQAEVKNLCAQVSASAQEGDCPKAPVRPGVAIEQPLLQTEKTTVDLVKLDPTMGAMAITARLGLLIVFLGNGEIRSNLHNAPTERVTEGDVIWVLAGTTETIQNSTGKGLSFLELAFNGTESMAKP